MNLATFIERWSKSGAGERANAQTFLCELCDILGVARPEPATTAGASDRYRFEYPLRFRHADGTVTTKPADLFKADCFLLEAKQGGDREKGVVRDTPTWEALMHGAYRQALRYTKALDRPPPLLIVCDVGFCFDLYESFDGSGVYAKFPNAVDNRIFLARLAEEPTHLATLRAVFEDPHSLNPATHAATVTQEIAKCLAKIARDLVPPRVGRQREEDEAYERAARFLMRCVFTMFAEDAKLFPEGRKPFTDALKRCKEPKDFASQVRSLWEKMNTGGDLLTVGEVLCFNGGLFRDPTVPALTKEHMALLLDAAERDWSQVEPAIFGALLEWALDPEERRRFGIHYTPRAYVERLARPTIEEPLRNDWDEVRNYALALAESGAEGEARAAVERFHRDLCAVSVLDPACGTANFLYVAMEIVHRIEAEVLAFRANLGGPAYPPSGPESGILPENFIGMEVNAWARELANLVFWIGYLQWYMRSHTTTPDPPILHGYGDNVLARDAVLGHSSVRVVRDPAGAPRTRWDGESYTRDRATGARVPDETQRVPLYRFIDPRQSEWPKTTFIVGNPPFLGASNIRSRFGEEYADALRTAYEGEVQDSADYVMYWWHRAAKLVAAGSARRFGFITTKAIGQTFNRRVVEQALSAKAPVHIAYAIPNHPWVDAERGAAVRIAMTVASAGHGPGIVARVVDERPDNRGANDVTLATVSGEIHADLSVGADVTRAVPLRANERLCSPGVKLHGAGFIVTTDEARALGLGRVEGLERHIRPYRNGRDLAGVPRDVRVIDLFGLEAEGVRESFPSVYQRVRDLVKPERDANNREVRRRDWWLFGENVVGLRRALQGLRRYIATPETAKHRFFVFLDGDVLPDNMLVNIALDDAYFLGVLSSRVHVAWALAAGGRLGVGNDPRYNKTRCFDTFPFPAADELQRMRIRKLAQQLDNHRKRRLAEHDGLTLTGIYNVLDKVRAGEPLTAKDRAVRDEALVTVLAELHDDLDAAVLSAYGWPRDIEEGEIIEKLVTLNAERAAAEKDALRPEILWLRREFQGLGADEQAGQQRLPWPTTFPDRQVAVRKLVEASAAPLAMLGIVKAFNASDPREVEEVVESLFKLDVLEPMAANGERFVRVRTQGLLPGMGASTPAPPQRQGKRHARPAAVDNSRCCRSRQTPGASAGACASHQHRSPRRERRTLSRDPQGLRASDRAP